MPSAISSPQLAEHRRRRRQDELGFHSGHTTTCHSDDSDGDGGHLGPRSPTTILPARVRCGRLRPAPATESQRGSRASKFDRSGRRRRDQPRAWARTSSRSCSVTVAGERGDLGRVDPPRAAAMRDVDARRHAARPGRHHDDAIAEAGRLAHVVGDEQHGQSAAPGRAASSSSWSESRVIASRAPNGSSISRTRRPGRAPGPARRAGACRPRAGADAWRRSRRGARSSSSCSTRARRSALRHAGEPHRQLDVGRPRSATGTAPTPGTSAPVAPSTSTAPAVGCVEAGDEVEDRRLAAPGRTDEADELAARRPRGRRRASAVTAWRPAPNDFDTPRSEIGRVARSGIPVRPPAALAALGEDLVEQVEVVDARTARSTWSSRPTAMASSAEPCSDAAIGSSVNSRCSQAPADGLVAEAARRDPPRCRR